MIKIVAISDVHTKWNKLIIPKCDILISAGDYSFRGESHLVKDFHGWLNKQDATHIISVQGNHELWVENNFKEAKDIALAACPRVDFLDEGLVEIDDIKIWGSAITPWFHSWAWNRHPQEITKHWNRIPNDINILITHGPPYNILDKTIYSNGDPRLEPLGCPQLLKRIKELKDLDLHFFGHIHNPGGEQHHEDGISFYNSAICNELYLPINPITIVEYIKD